MTALQHPPLHHGIDPWSPAQRARLVRLCAAVVGPAAAEDVAQEALLEAWRQRAKLVDATGADAWLGAIARNVCRRHLHKHGRDRAVPTDALPEEHHHDLDHLEREVRRLRVEVHLGAPISSDDLVEIRSIADDVVLATGAVAGAAPEAAAGRVVLSVEDVLAGAPVPVGRGTVLSSPPGIDRRTRPNLVSSGPSTLIEARIRSTSS